nr:zinc finger, CCHC-type [Tanacetum cinerariifolium]
MGDENPICTFGDYSKPSHEGYKNTIELLVGNNVIPLQSDTIRLVQNGCSFHGLRSEDPNQHLRDFLKLVDSLELDGENRERTCLRLFQFSLRDQASNWLECLLAGSITTWEDLTTRFLAQFFPSGRNAKLRNDILMKLHGFQKYRFNQPYREGGAQEKGNQKLIKAISLKYQSPESIIELNKDPSAPKHVLFVNLIVILIKESEAEEGETTTDITPEHGHNITKEVNEEVKEVIDEKESKVKTDEEVEEILKDEEEDKYGKRIENGAKTDESPFTCDSTPNIVDDSPNVFNPPSQPPKCSYEFCGNDAYYGHDCPPQVPFTYDPEPCYNQDFNFSQNSQNFQQQYLCCTRCDGLHETFQCQQVIFYESCCENYGGPHETYQCQPMNEDCYHEQNSCYNSNSFGFDQFYPNNFLSLIKLLSKKIPICYDDDEDYTIAITPKEPDNSLSMGNEHLDTILATESDEFIKSSVENLVSNPNESEGEHECNMLACDYFTTFSNLLFDVDDDFSSSDDEPFSDEDISKKIYPNPLFDEEIISMKIDLHHFNAESDLIESLLNQNSSIISSSLKINYLLDEFAGKLILLKSIPLRIDETDYDPKEEIRLVERLFNDNSSPRSPKEFNFE